MTDTPDPQRGDVEFVGFADNDKAEAARQAAKAADPRDRLLRAPVPAANERVKVRLHGHPFDFVVRVKADPATGPVLTEFAVSTKDDSEAVTHAALRSVPLRRLAYSAHRFIATGGGLVGSPGDYREMHTRPDVADPRLGELHWRIEQAIRDGLPVRPTVAADLGISTKTLDRLIAKAKAENLLEGVELSRRPPPRQRDALRARHMLELWLDEHGPNEPMPPEMRAELDRLRASANTPPPTKRQRKRP